MDTQRIIKKYPNRRLYDTQKCVYITLSDIKQLVIDQVDFQVIDARSKKDLTQATLLQIINEQENSANPIFTTALLSDFIRFYHKNSQTLLRDYLSQAMQFLNDQNHFLYGQWKTYQKFLSNPLFTFDPSKKNKFK